MNKSVHTKHWQASNVETMIRRLKNIIIANLIQELIGDLTWYKDIAH